MRYGLAIVILAVCACADVSLGEYGVQSAGPPPPNPNAYPTRTISAAAFTGAVAWNPVRASGQNAAGEMFAALPMQDGETPLSLAVSARAPNQFELAHVSWIRTSASGGDFVIAEVAVIPPLNGAWARWELPDPAPRPLLQGEALTVRVAGFGVSFGNSTVEYQPPGIQ
jgi:hypothetical protein